MNDENDKNDDGWGMTMPHLRLDKDKKAADFSDDYAPNPYAARSSSDDEWGATQPNFNLPKNEFVPTDFDKTAPNINIPKDLWHEDNPLSLPSSSSPPPQLSTPPPSSGDDWGMSQPNINVPPQNRQQPPNVWETTAPNINIPPASAADDWVMNAPPAEKKDEWSMPAPVFRESEGEKVDNLPKRAANFDQAESIGYDKTVPNFNLSEVSPPGIYGASAASAPVFQAQSGVAETTPVNQIAQEAPKTEKSGGSKLIYALGGLIVLLFFGIVTLAAGYFLFFNKSDAAQQSEIPKDAIEAPKETSETAASSVPVIAAAPAAASVLPNQVDYQGTMILVAAGKFTMGSDIDAEESKPAHEVTLPAFYIDKTEVTNGEYKKFCDATGKTPPPDPHLEKGYFASRPNAPVVGVSFADAQSYASWAGKRLPTEAEWEKAASWDETAKAKRTFPWGDDFQKSNAAFGLTEISDVGKFSAGASSGGALDMAGNVLEWVDAFFQPYPNTRSVNAEFGEKNRVVRGGHFGSKSSDSLKTTKRIYVAPDIASGEDDEKLVAAIIGFRCAVSADDADLKTALSAQSK